MARPRKEGLDYFPHDTDAVHDEKLELLRASFGNDGYAFYFILLERIYRSPDAELDVSEAEIQKMLAHKCMVSYQQFINMLKACLKHGIFDAQTYAERGVLTSEGIKKRAGMVFDRRQKSRSAYVLEKVGNQPGVMDAETPTKTPQSKVNKRKEKESIYSLEFEQFWMAYPRKVEKARAWRAWQTRTREGAEPADVMKACENYAKHMAGGDPKFIKHPATFLGPDKPFEDWINPKAQGAEPVKPKLPDCPDCDNMRVLYDEATKTTNRCHCWLAVYGTKEKEAAADA